jgi:hypothetical protein
MRAVTKEEQRRLRATHREERQAKLNAKRAIVKAMLYGSFERYLLGP